MQGRRSWCQSKAHSLSHLPTLDVSTTVCEILTFKARKWLFPTPDPPYCDAPARGTRQNFWMKLIPAKTRCVGRKNVIILTSAVFD